MDAQSAAAPRTGSLAGGPAPGGAGALPGLPSHPSNELAKRQQRCGGAIVSFEVKVVGRKPGRLSMRPASCRSPPIWATPRRPLTHPASTTHGRISPEAREAAGIRESLLRVAVGLESVDDLKADLARGLALIDV